MEEILLIAKRIYTQSQIMDKCKVRGEKSAMARYMQKQCDCLNKALSEYLAKDKLYRAVFGEEEYEKEDIK